MVGIAEMYFAKFIVSLELGQVASGLVMTLPLLLGAGLALVGPRLLKRVGSFARYNGTMAAVQGLALFPLAGAALCAHLVMPPLREAGLEWVATAVLFIIVTLYYFGALATLAPWTTITGALVPTAIRANYNARRLRLLQGATLGALLLHGGIADGMTRIWVMFDLASKTDLSPLLAAFALAFILGGIFRLISAWHLWHYSSPASSPGEQRDIHFKDFFSRFRHGNDGRFLLYVLAGNFALQISQPYTNPFMLTQVEFTGWLHSVIVNVIGPNAPYSILLAAVYLGRVLALPLAGKVAQRSSGHRLLWIGGLTLIPLALFWLVSPRFEWLLIGQVLTGAALGVWELGTFLMNYEALKPSERTAMLTYYSVANETSKSAGSLAGAGLLEVMNKSPAAYAAVFVASAIARVGAIALLQRVKRPQGEGRDG
jgi:hypothetical protein